MSRLYRFVAATMAICFFLSTTGLVVHAQWVFTEADSVVRPPQSDDTMAAGVLDGEMLAEGHRTGGKFGAGLGVGLLTGLIGTGIGYFVIGPEQLSAEAVQRSAGKSPDYQLGLKTGWERKTQSRKRKAFLAGGLLGTAAFVALVVAAQSAEE
jgi:hypothetical protein